MQLPRSGRLLLIPRISLSNPPRPGGLQLVNEPAGLGARGRRLALQGNSQGKGGNVQCLAASARHRQVLYGLLYGLLQARGGAGLLLTESPQVSQKDRIQPGCLTDPASQSASGGPASPHLQMGHNRDNVEAKQQKLKPLCSTLPPPGAPSCLPASHRVVQLLQQSPLSRRGEAACQENSPRPPFPPTGDRAVQLLQHVLHQWQ